MPDAPAPPEPLTRAAIEAGFAAWEAYKGRGFDPGAESQRWFEFAIPYLGAVYRHALADFPNASTEEELAAERAIRQQRTPLSREKLERALVVWGLYNAPDVDRGKLSARQEDGILEEFTEFFHAHGGELIGLALSALGRIERWGSEERDALANYILARLSRGPMTVSAILTPVLADLRQQSLVHHTASNHWAAGPAEYGDAALRGGSDSSPPIVSAKPELGASDKAGKPGRVKKTCPTCGTLGHTRRSCPKRPDSAPPVAPTPGGVPSKHNRLGMPAAPRKAPKPKPAPRTVPPAPDWMAKPLKPPGKLSLDERLEDRRHVESWRRSEE